MILCERYKIVRSIKSGGMGAVYLAQDQRLGDSPCAVKAMLDAVKGGAHEDIIRRKFQSEAEVLSQLQHPGIPAVRDYFVEAETAYIVMDFVEGENLELKKGEPLAPEVVTQIALEVLEILTYLHGRPTPVVHCDIKPANLIRETASGRIKLVDFGLARALSDQKTQTVAGTLGYSAMEQLRGHAEPRSDLYALGITMFHMLTGQVPTFLLVPPIREILPDLDPRLAAVIDSSTRMEADQRPQSAQQMRQALSDWLAHKDRPPSAAELAEANRIAAGRLNWRQNLKALLQKARGKPPENPAVFEEPCPACQGPVPSDRSHCPKCQHKLDPEPLQVKQALGQALTFPFRQPARLAGCLLLMLLLLACHHYGPWLVHWWPLANLLPESLLALLWLGYPLAVANQRIRTGQPGLPGWGDGRLHLRRGLQTIMLTLAVLGLPWLLLFPVLLVTLSIAAQGAMFFLMLALTLAVVLFVVSMRQCTLWPWAWSSLADRNHLPTAVDLTAVVHQGGTHYQGRWLLQALLALLWFALSALLGSLWWPLSALSLTLGLLASADFCASVHRAHFLRELPDWVGSYRSLLGRSWRPYNRQSQGRSAYLYGALSALVALVLLGGALIPSLEGHRYPALAANHKIGYINQNGWMAIAPQFTGAFPFSGDSQAVPARLGNHWGYLRRNGTWMVEPKYEEAFPFSDGLARVKDHGLYGYIDKMGSLAIQPQYKFAREFHEGLAAASNDDKLWGFIDRYGWRIKPQFFGRPQDFSEGRAGVRVDDNMYLPHYGFVNTDGILVLDHYTSVGKFRNGQADVEFSNGQAGNYFWKTIDRQGKILGDAETPTSGPRDQGEFQEGVAWFQTNEGYGYLREDGSAWLRPQFTEAYDFQDGVALVRMENDIGYINHQGQLFWRTYVAGPDETVRMSVAALRPNFDPNPVFTNHLPDPK